MSKLAGQHSGSVFGADRTSGVDFWVAGAGVLLVDTPPMLTSRSRPVPTRMRRHEEKRDYVNDLQVATLMLQICDTLLVVVNNPSGGCVPLAHLLASAADMVPNIPGLRPLATPGQANGGTPGCSLHIVVNCYETTSSAQADKKQISQTYERLTGISVSGVTVLGNLTSKPPADLHIQIARQWADPYTSLYPSFHSRQSLVSWDE
ncbi:hypothetical protein FBU59_007109, partial [Linderina macrospora]